MYLRLAVESRRLELYGLRHRQICDEMVERMSGEADPGPLKVLASVVQPPRGYERQQLRKFDDFTPLNHLDDAVSPESDTAREFSEIATRIAAGKASAQDLQQARDWLMLWRDNDAKLQPLLARSFLTQDLVPVSRNLSKTAEIGLRALDHLQSHTTKKADEWQNDMQFLKEAEKPHAVLLLMVPAPVETLVQAAEHSGERR